MKKILRLKSSKKKSKELKVRSKCDQYPESANGNTSGETLKISPKDLKHLMNVMNLIDRYASKGKYEKAIASCRHVLNGIQNDPCFPLAMFMNKLNELEHKVKMRASTESILNEKKTSELDDRTIAFVKRSLEFIRQIKDTDARTNGFAYLQFLCRQELYDRLSDELNKARILDLQAYLNVEQAKCEEAIELTDEAIKIRGLTHIDNKEMLISFDCKSYAYFSMKEYSKAVPFIEVTLKIAESNQAIDRHFLAFTLNNLALIYLKSRTNCEKIDGLFERALQITRSIDFSSLEKSKREMIRTLIEKIEYARQFTPFQIERDNVLVCGWCGYIWTKTAYESHCPGCESKSKPSELLVSQMRLIKCHKCGSLVTYVEEAKTANCSAARCETTVKILENHLDFYLIQLNDFY